MRRTKEIACIIMFVILLMTTSLPIISHAAESTDGQDNQAEGNNNGENGENNGSEGNSEENPNGITIGGHTFNVAPAIANELVPQDFTKTTITCKGQEVEGLQFDKAALTLIYLTTPSKEVKNTLAVFDEASGAAYQFRKVEMGEQYVILLDPPAETGFPADYTLASASIGGFEEVPVYVTSSAISEFSLVYAASSHGNIGWYQYDTTEGTFQRYVQTPEAGNDTVIEPSETDGAEVSVEMEGLQKAYKELEAQAEEQKGNFKKILAAMIFVVAVLLVVIINLILRKRSNKKDDFDDVFAEPKKTRKRIPIEDDWDEEVWEDDPDFKRVSRQDTKTAIKPEMRQEMKQDFRMKPETAGKPKTKPEPVSPKKRDADFEDDFEVIDLEDL